MAERDIFLMWVPGHRYGWAVFDAYSCPNPTNFPDWMYRRYTIPTDKWKEVFNKLKGIKEKLDTEGIIPTKNTQKNIFPELSDLLDSP
jgi:hypothetical protein